MQTIKINASSSYNIYVGEGILTQCGEIINCVKNYKKAVIVTDDIVEKLYAKTVIESLQRNGISVTVFAFKNGEESKSHKTLIDLYEFLSQNGISRTDLIIALGGGVVGDLTGFACATYLRGLDFIQIPTTLLAQTDSSIGGKTAVNISSGKNLVGAFKQPECVICDTATLKTLSDEVYSDGISEIIKYGMIKSSSLFETLSRGINDSQLISVITECINIKKSVVEADEFDKGERMLLNFGHTFGHAIEKAHNYTGITHGKAVAIGMMIISEYSEKAGITQKGTTAKLKHCLEKYNLPTSTDFKVSELISTCLNDKKRETDNINLILCDDIGKSEIRKISIPDFYKLMEVTNV